MTRLIRIACVLALFAAGCGVPGPYFPRDSFNVDFTPPEGDPESTPRGVIVFVVDGVNPIIFDEMLASGLLPEIDKYFVSRGLYAPRTASNVPSVTLSSLTTLATGQLPGHHEVTGNNWFDRNRLLCRDYDTIAQKNTLDEDYACPNIYESFPDEPTVSIFFQPHRSADKFFENWLSAGPPYFFGWYDFIDRLTLHRFGEMMDIARGRFGRMPVLTFAYLLSPDMLGYEHGVSSPQYRNALVSVSRYIGRLLRDLERAGLLDRFVLAFVSDHGLGDVKAHFDLARYLDTSHGLKVTDRIMWEQNGEKDRSKHYDRFRAVLNMCGDRYAALSLRGAGPWSKRPGADEIQKGYPGLLDGLVSMAAVDAVAWRSGPDRCRVRTKARAFEFSQPGGREGKISCEVVCGADTFGWSGRTLAPREWLEATIDTAFPDLPAQILAYFRSPRSGDVAIFAAPGWDFGTKNRAGHGGLRAGHDMLVPMIIAGPGVPRKRVPAARTADLVPTIIRLLDRPVPPGLDGRILVK